MKKVKVRFNGVDNITEFVNIVEKSGVKADLGQGNIEVDASSLVGVISMDTRNPLTLTINENDDIADQLINKIETYIVE